MDNVVFCKSLGKRRRNMVKPSGKSQSLRENLKHNREAVALHVLLGQDSDDDDIHPESKKRVSRWISLVVKEPTMFLPQRCASYAAQGIGFCVKRYLYHVILAIHEGILG
ncbi:unnamed protein product [Eruca vesicaria subsp. sativa]|uniref:Uncharacterized protein n=1 Tax=Eruca vesicaria subsp. sativa TaxID=29727 RepID=A0ABC8M749_ERUVS|nr:unnamed protein product [Eruca vesicaria subsp. sativa]